MKMFLDQIKIFSFQNGKNLRTAEDVSCCGPDSLFKGSGIIKSQNLWTGINTKAEPTFIIISRIPELITD